MISISTLKAVLREQKEDLKRELAGTIPREHAMQVEGFRGRTALIVKGIRRCGKSTLLGQALFKKRGEKFHYLNFDDERLAGFVAGDFQTMMEAFYQEEGRHPALLLDEIQNVDGWELFVNRMLRSQMAVYLTGSNSDLLSEELGTRMTGRHTDVEMFPFSFVEYLAAKQVPVPSSQTHTTEESARLACVWIDYLREGGMPEAVLGGNPAVLSQVVDDIIHKDILHRHSVRKPQELRTALTFLLSISSSLFTFNALTKHFPIKSHRTVQKYFQYAQSAYLLFAVEKFERKMKLLDKNPRKVYGMDTGIVRKNSASVSEDLGALLENAVAIELKRRGRPFYYYSSRNGHECDFLVVDSGVGKKPLCAIQVCYDMSGLDTARREERGLLACLAETGLKEGLIITTDGEKEVKKEGKTIRYMPAYKWMMGKG
ncbi:MAG: ATP-binding protein [Candidatus Micrarchaeota archaeon]